MNQADALAGLVAARDALGAIGIMPFLVDGTLLGAIREGGFISHDTDTDMAIFREELDVIRMIQAMTAAGFVYRKKYGRPSRGCQLVFARNEVKLDIFVYYRDTHLFHAAWKRGRPIRYEYEPFTLAPLEFLGETFMAPSDPVRFLVAKYGRYWRTPVKKWDWAWGPVNARPWR